MFKSKFTRKFLDKKYDELYERAKKISAALNPCNIHQIRDLSKGEMVTTCNGHGLGCAYGTAHNKLCCNAFEDEPVCQHLSGVGCTVKSLRCVLWFCDEMIMLPLKSDIPHQHHIIMGPTEAHPDMNYFLGYARFVFLNQAHRDIYEEAKAYGFLRYFRTGKMKAIDYAYHNRDKIKEPITSKALSVGVYAAVERGNTGESTIKEVEEQDD